jgi:hypothetical protein
LGPLFAPGAILFESRYADKGERDMSRLLKLDIQAPEWRKFQEALCERLRHVPCRADMSGTRSILNQWGYAPEPSISHFMDLGAVCDCTLASFKPVTHDEFSATRPADIKAAGTTKES